MISPLKLYIHTRMLRKKYNINVRWRPGLWFSYKAKACYPTMTIEMYSPVCSEETYAIFMHELGHLVSREQQWSYLQGLEDKAVVIIRNEKAAWTWAAENAIVWTSAMTKLAEFALGTYYKTWGVEHVVNSHSYSSNP